MNKRKREKPYPSRQAPYSAPKRRRSVQLDAGGGGDAVEDSSKAPKSVMVIGVPTECSVLDLKSRFEMYGSISRTRMDPNGIANITFRSNDAAQSAINAARDPDFPLTLHSVPVQVMWANDPVPQWGAGVGRNDGMFSKLVRAELPLRRHGRGNKLGSAIVKLSDENDDTKSNNDLNDSNHVKNVGAGGGNSGAAEGSFRGREIVAYDDIL